MNDKKLVKVDGSELSVEDEKVNVKMHPNLIFAVRLKKEKTAAGVYLPDRTSDLTPLMLVKAVGENVTVCSENDVIYVNPAYQNFAEIDGVKGAVLMQDAVIGLVPKEEENVSE